MTTTYHYAVLERPETALQVDTVQGIDMENLDYKRQPDVEMLRGRVSGAGGTVLGIWRGGLFGLATNQVAMLSAWEDADAARACHTGLGAVEHYCGRATVRPEAPEVLRREGIYVIRWIRMATSDIAEYTALCLETWPAFQADGTAYCYGVFRPLDDAPVSKLLMLTWYASLADWEQTRTLSPADEAKWARRSEMELSHWADVGRLAV